MSSAEAFDVVNDGNLPKKEYKGWIKVQINLGQTSKKMCIKNTNPIQNTVYSKCIICLLYCNVIKA